MRNREDATGRYATSLRSEWLRAAFGLEANQVLPRIPLRELPPIWPGGFLRVDAIVEPVWIPDGEPDVEDRA